MVCLPQWWAQIRHENLSWFPEQKQSRGSGLPQSSGGGLLERWGKCRVELLLKPRRPKSEVQGPYRRFLDLEDNSKKLKGGQSDGRA